MLVHLIFTESSLQALAGTILALSSWYAFDWEVFQRHSKPKHLPSISP
jgi:hypothetical protein